LSYIKGFYLFFVCSTDHTVTHRNVELYQNFWKIFGSRRLQEPSHGYVRCIPAVTCSL